MINGDSMAYRDVTSLSDTDLWRPFTELGLAEWLEKLALAHHVTIRELLSSRQRHATAARREAWKHLRSLNWGYIPIAKLFHTDSGSVQRGVLAKNSGIPEGLETKV